MTVPCFARGLHRLLGDERRRLRQRAEDAAGVEPARAEAAEDLVPVDVCPASSCETAVWPRSEQPSAARTPKPRSVKLSPLRTVRPTPSYLTHVTRCSTPPWNIRSSTRRPTGLSASAVTMAVSRPKQRLQPAGDVVLAAALPDLERARGVDAEVARIEPEHDFAEGHAIPAAGIARPQFQLGHGTGRLPHLTNLSHLCGTLRTPRTRVVPVTLVWLGRPPRAAPRPGPCARSAYEPRQGRKAAALSSA